MNVGFLHPGLMGETLAASCGATSLWASEGRSADTVDRAKVNELVDAGSVAELCERAEVIVSICPPAAAKQVAAKVASHGFGGTYVDANAISPTTARAIGEHFDRFVDGSVVGPPAHQAGTTRLFLSGDEAASVAELWAGSVLEPIVLDGDAGAASALKMAYATWTKVSSALLLDVCALAEAEGVADALAAEWERSQPGTAKRAQRVASAVAPKAWRFVGEMHQIAAAFDDAGLPTGFADGAAAIYDRMADFKGTADTSLDDVIEALRR